MHKLRPHYSQTFLIRSSMECLLHTQIMDIFNIIFIQNMNFGKSEKDLFYSMDEGSRLVVTRFSLPPIIKWKGLSYIKHRCTLVTQTHDYHYVNYCHHISLLHCVYRVLLSWAFLSFLVVITLKELCDCINESYPSVMMKFTFTLLHM